MNESIGITLWNAQGITSETMDFIMQNIPMPTDFFFITETWLRPQRSLPTTWIQIHNYGISVDRASRGQYGISLLINPSFPYTVLPLPIYQESNYILPCLCQNYLFICTYLPPNLHDQICFDLLTEAIQHYSDNYTYDHLILCGDFNARLGNYVGDKRENTRYHLFLDFVHRHCLTLHNIQHAFGIPTFIRGNEANPTDKSSIIDFFLTTHPVDTPGIFMDVHNDVYLGSDHKMVFFSFPSLLAAPAITNTHPRRLWNIQKLKPSHRHPDRHIEYIRHYRSCITPLLRNLQTQLDSVSLSSLPSQQSKQEYLDSINSQLLDIIYTSLDASVRRKTPRDRTWKWFYTQDLADACKHREVLYKKWKNATQFNKVIFWEQFQQAAEVVRLLVQRNKRHYFKKFCDKLSTSEFSKAASKIKNIKRSRAQPSSNVFRHIDGPQAAVDAITTSWQDTYDGKYLNPHVEHIPVETPPPQGFDMDISFDLQDVQFAIKCLPTGKAPGFDHIKSEMIKPITDLISPVLHQLFSLCWKYAIVPTAYNRAQVIPIYKKGPVNDPKNHRPISLICTFRKIYEICLYNALLPHSVPLDPVQGGFRHQRSTLDQALCLQELILRYKKTNKEHPILLFLDIKSAYDTTDRNIVWKALRDHNVETPLLTTLQLLFNQVQIEVLLNGHVSTAPFTPTTGVLQGSTLSPHLYSIYINSLAHAVRDAPMFTPAVYTHINPPSSQIVNGITNHTLIINSLFFADDVVLLGNASNAQALLDAAQQHSITLGYRWNPAKSALILPPHLKSATPPPSFTLYDQPIPAVNSFKYLGIYFNHKGIDNKQMLIHNASKGSQAMHLLHSLGANATGFDKILSFKFYKCFIRPIFEYAFPLLTPTTNDFKIVEKAQDNACRLIMHGHRSSSTHVIKHMNNLPNMCDRMVVLCAKNLVRINQLPSDALITLFIQQLLTTRECLLKKLQHRNPIWQQLIASLTINRSTRQIIIAKSDLKDHVQQYLLDQWHLTQAKFAYASHCRTTLGTDPIMYLPMTIYERSRLIRWRMGWLPGKPQACRNCNQLNTLTTQQHVVACFQVNENLNMDIHQLLNRLPTSPPKSKAAKFYWTTHWIVLQQFLFNLESICLPLDETINPDSYTDNSPFISWINNTSSSTVIPTQTQDRQTELLVGLHPQLD